jgi:maltose O-acetyltransferase
MTDDADTDGGAMARRDDAGKAGQEQTASSTVTDVSIDNPPQDVDELIARYNDVRALFAGEWMRYRTSDILPRLTAQTQATCALINRIYFDDTPRAVRLFHRLIPAAGKGVDFRPPISLDYGIGLTIGEGTFLNCGFLITGGGRVTIGEHCLIGSRCSIYTPNHALAAGLRLQAWERTSAVTIGDDVWLGGSVTICPGVHIGDNSVIGAGSVVTKDIPGNVVAVGNPCHVIKQIPAQGDGGAAGPKKD